MAACTLPSTGSTRSGQVASGSKRPPGSKAPFGVTWFVRACTSLAGWHRPAQTPRGMNTQHALSTFRESMQAPARTLPRKPAARRLSPGCYFWASRSWRTPTPPGTTRGQLQTDKQLQRREAKPAAACVLPSPRSTLAPGQTCRYWQVALGTLVARPLDLGLGFKQFVASI